MVAVQRKFNPTEAPSVRKGDLMAIVSYVKVKEVLEKGGRVIKVTDIHHGHDFDITGVPLVESCLSAVQFSEEVKITKTDCAKLLMRSFNRPFTINWDKLPDKNGVRENRTLRGRLLHTEEDVLGYSHVEDLDLPSVRMVDHREIYWLVVDGVKYTVKSK